MRKLLGIIFPLLVLFLLYLVIRAVYILPAFDEIDPLENSLVETQVFLINANEETVLSGKKGTLIWIGKNTFSDCNGNLIQGQVQLSLTEVLETQEMIISNIQTISDNEILESGGMIHLIATKDGQNLCISDSSAIGVVIPTDSVVNGMKLFQGVERDGIINWQDPVPIVSDPDSIRIGAIPEEVLDAYGGFANFPWDRSDEVYWEVNPISRKSLAFYDSLYANTIADYKADEQLRYVFETNELGWLNIDKVLQGEGIEAVKLRISITNREQFHTVFAKLVLKEKKSVVQGFEAGEGKVAFSYSKDNIVYLPTDSPAVIITTAYRNRKPYCSIHKFIISTEQNIIVELVETTQADLESTIEKIL